MELSLLSPMRCHHFDLAVHLCEQNIPTSVFTGYPRWKLRREALVPSAIKTFPWVFTPKVVLNRLGFRNPRVFEALEWWSRKTLDRYVAHHLGNAQIIESLSSFGLEAGRMMKQQGGRFIVHRGSAHMRYQMELLEDEFKRWGLSFSREDERIVQRELSEYNEADLINVPSEYVRQTFIEQGIPSERIAAIPYGVDLSGFHKVCDPDPQWFDILFVGQISLRKGVPYLLEAFKQFKHPKKRLTLVGKILPEMKALLPKLPIEQVIFIPGMARSELKKIMSRSQVMVLPSVDDGFGKVITEAMACGCPVICSENTGAPGFLTEGVEGFITPVRDIQALADRFQLLADNPHLREKMSLAAQAKMRQEQGWKVYTKQFIELCKRLLESSS